MRSLTPSKSVLTATWAAWLLSVHVARIGLRNVDDLAVFFHEAADFRIGENIEHGLRRPAQPCALWRHDNRPVDQDRMRQHEIDQLFVAPFWVGKPPVRHRACPFRATARGPELP